MLGYRRRCRCRRGEAACSSSAGPLVKRARALRLNGVAGEIRGAIVLLLLSGQPRWSCSSAMHRQGSWALGLHALGLRAPRSTLHPGEEDWVSSWLPRSVPLLRRCEICHHPHVEKSLSASVPRHSDDDQHLSSVRSHPPNHPPPAPFGLTASLACMSRTRTPRPSWPPVHRCNPHCSTSTSGWRSSCACSLRVRGGRPLHAMHWMQNVICEMQNAELWPCRRGLRGKQHVLHYCLLFCPHTRLLAGRPRGLGPGLQWRHIRYRPRDAHNGGEAMTCRWPGAESWLPQSQGPRIATCIMAIPASRLSCDDLLLRTSDARDHAASIHPVVEIWTAAAGVAVAG